MSFQVKAKLVSFLGDIDRYPCHFCHEVGDEIIFDGEKFIGRLCPDVWPMLTPKVAALHSAGPRYVPPDHYYPFWYCSISERDSTQKIYDGLGFKNVLKTIEEPPYHMAHLVPANAFKWPPYEGDIAKEVAVICPDLRSAALFILEAFDLSEKGFDAPYFRRQMVILHKVLIKKSIEADRILHEFTKEEIEDIYPPLSQPMATRLVEELELMNYMKIENNKAEVTTAGKKKFDDFKKGLSNEEIQALSL